MKQLEYVFSYLNRQRNSEISPADRSSGFIIFPQVRIIRVK